MKKKQSFVFLFALLATLSLTADFVFKVSFNGWETEESYSLVFGEKAAEELAFFPPEGPGSTNAWFVGGGAADEDATLGNGRLATQILKTADAATWLVNANGNVKLSFKLDSGSLPTGAVLTMIEDGAEETTAVAIADGVDFNVEAGKNYLLRYKTSSAEYLPAAPATVFEQVLAGSTSAGVYLESAPTGYKLALDSTVYAFDADGKATVSSVAAALAGNTVNFTGTISGMASLQVRYRYTNTGDTLSTAWSTINLEVVDSLAVTRDTTELIAKGTTTDITTSYATIEPADTDSPILRFEYTLSFDDAMKGQAATITVSLPNITSKDPFPYEIYASYEDVSKTLSGKDSIYFGKATVSGTATGNTVTFNTTLPSTATYAPIEFYVKAKGGAEFGYVEVTAACISKSTTSANFTVYTTTGGTLDLDCDGDVTTDDVVICYNYVNAYLMYGEVEYITEDDLKAGLTGKDWKSALALLNSMVASNAIDFDRDGDVTTDDVVICYNYVNAYLMYGDVEYITEDDLKPGLTGKDWTASLKYLNSLVANVK